MTDPITPPLGWVLDLLNEARKRAKSSGCFGEVDYVYMVNKSAQMGWDQRGAANEVELQQRADQELEACVQLMPSDSMEKYLRTARRPKPPSLKEQALGAVGRFTVNAHTNANEMNRDFDTIRRALEQLND